MSEVPAVEVRGLVKEFPVKQGRGRAPAILRAVNGISFTIERGATLGLVGESGSGKSTTGRVLVGLTGASAGSVRLFGKEITGPDGPANLNAVRRRLQFVFQDPFGSLNPRMRVGDSIAEPLDVSGAFDRAGRQRRVDELLETVGLPKSCAVRYPHEFSGGQRQRIGIARALALKPEFIVCDEPVSALDVSMQAQIINLLRDLQEVLGLTYLFIAHDLGVVRHISTHVAVMYCGELVEIAPKQQLFRTPRHPYTQALLSSVPRPRPDRRRRALVAGDIPSLINPPPGCKFHQRCPKAMPRCAVEAPALRETNAGQRVACHLYP